MLVQAGMLDIHTLEHLSVDGIISHNGGFIYIDNKKIRSSSLDGDFLEKFIKKTDSLGISVEIFTDFGAFSTLEPNEYVVESNWFDAFCNWLSKIFGGK